jgi:hypothetical protein
MGFDFDTTTVVAGAASSWPPERAMTAMFQRVVFTWYFI